MRQIKADSSPSCRRMEPSRLGLDKSEKEKEHLLKGDDDEKRSS